MFRVVVLPVGLGLLFLSSAYPARAATITNRDDRPYRITITEGEAKSEQVIAPGAVLQSFCLTGCLVGMDGKSSELYELEGPDLYTIEAGEIYFQSAGAGGEQSAPDDGAKPQEPRKQK